MDSVPSAAPHPLTLVQDDDPQVANDATKRFLKPSRFSRVFSVPKLRSTTKTRRASSDLGHTASLQDPSEIHISALDITPITLDNSALTSEDIATDRYEWAILYENQRGLTFFSVPYYSSLSLLPSDPSPFTLPNASFKRSSQPPVSLDSYPLPDGNWHWVSRCWMIDMRNDSGEVQHDGFEYNWIFRRHDWRAQIGFFNAGGWVRRRRWIRLMVRPAKPRKEETEGYISLTPSTNDLTWKTHRQSIASTSLGTHHTDAADTWDEGSPFEVWLGDTEFDWQRCRSLMKHLGRDGRKLELWKLWLGFYHPETPNEIGKRREKQWTEDDGPLPSEPPAVDILSKERISIAPREHVLAVLRAHGQQMLHLFVFPESRVQFLKLLGQANILPELDVGPSIGFGNTEIEFWSYANGLGEVDTNSALLPLRSQRSVATV